MFRKLIGALLLLALASAAPVSAQVEQVAIRAVNLACGTCALVSEINLRRIEGVEKVSISRSAEAVLISFGPDAAFRPKAIRDVFEPLKVEIRSFQISARGRVLQQGPRRAFVAGKDTFLIVDTPTGPKIPVGTPILVQAVLVNDRIAPMEIRIMAVGSLP
jgi:hypothetical protein